MVKHLRLLIVGTACVAGCGSLSSTKENWAYLGDDRTIRSPPAMRLGDSSDAAWRSEAAEKVANWQRLRQAATGAAKETCARETGESVTPHPWTGYSAAFTTCMKARGWLCCFSDPL